MKPEGVRAYIFDVDDTVYEEKQFVRAAMKDVSLYLSEKYDIPSDRIYDFCMNSIESGHRGRTFNMLCEEFSIDEDVDKIVDIYRSCETKLDLYDDTKALIEKIKAAGLKIGVITDGFSKVQRSKVKGLGLFEIADAVIISYDYTDENGKPLCKPDTRVYEMCLEKLGVKPEEAVYIGDNPLKDFIGARKLGMKTVHIKRKGSMFENETAAEGYEADFEVEKLTELI